jgi:predicted RNA-binding Zn-ribbon protein involved in translation (DUF1610 family)
MGVLDFLKNIFRGKSNQKFKCPNCGYYPLTPDTEKCPGCGIDVKSTFRLKCPKCGTYNELGAKKCMKCGHAFSAEKEKVSYSCSVCGYESDSFFTVCPTCGTKVV